MQRNIAIDIFRLVASFFVICIHAPFITWGLNPIYKCAVPFFCILTGYYLNIENSSYKQLSKRILKYLKILGIAVAAYFLLAFIDNYDIEAPNLLDLFLYNSFGFINASHLWYLLALAISIGIICLFKFLRAPWLVYLFIPLIIVSPLGKYNTLPELPNLISHYDANWILTTMPYIAVGMALRKINLNTLKSRWCFIISIVALIVTLAESYFLGAALNPKSAVYLGTPFYTIFGFLFLLSLNIPATPALTLFADFCRRSSLIIYVWHYFIINVMKDLGIYNMIQPFATAVVLIMMFAIMQVPQLLAYAKARI